MGLSSNDMYVLRSVMLGIDRPHAIARRVNMAPPSVSRSIERLVGQGLLERAPAPDDGRAVVLHLTASGHRTIEHALDLAEAGFAEAYAAIDPARGSRRRTHGRPARGDGGRDHGRALRPLPAATRLAFGGVLAVLALASTNMTIVGTALPRIIAELDGFGLYAWAFTAFTLTSTVSIPVYGRLGDRYGRKPILLFGIVVFTLASVVAGFSQTMLELVAMRALQGLGGGALMGMTWAVLGDLFTPRERGAYQGITSGVFGVSSVIGPVIGGVITDTLGWRWVFFVVVP
jgi:DNA-binding MarR family transcriptional regulator